MEHIVPISIAVCGHPLVESVALSWSANQGMIPQALRFGSAGGTATADLTCQTSEPISIHYRAKINYRLPGWGVVELDQVRAIAPEAAQIVLDPGAWVKQLTVQLQIEAEDCDQNCDRAQDHMIVNLTWNSPSLHQSKKDSGRVTPQTPVQFTYLQHPQQRDTTATLSGFGVVQAKLLQIPPQSISLDTDLLSLYATQTTIQLLQPK